MKKLTSIVTAMLLAAASIVLQAGCGDKKDPDADIKAAGEEQHEEETPDQKKASEKFSFEGQGKAPPKK